MDEYKKQMKKKQNDKNEKIKLKNLKRKTIKTYLKQKKEIDFFYDRVIIYIELSFISPISLQPRPINSKIKWDKPHHQNVVIGLTMAL